MIDIHSHILPLVDDGSSSVDMSLDMLDFVGSDAHNLRSRHPRMYESYVQVKTRFGSDYAQRIFKENGKILLNGGKV